MSGRLLVTVPTDELRDEVVGRPEVDEVADVVVWDLVTTPPAPWVDLVVPPYMASGPALAALVEHADLDVGLLQSQSIGYDGIDQVLGGRFAFSNAAGVHEASTAELAVGLVIASLRGFPAFARAHATGEWLFGRNPALADRTVLVIGYGGVGQAISDRLRPFEVDVVPVASTARDTADGRVRGVAELPDLLPTADVVVLAVPLSPATTGLVDADFLAAMKEGALLVNVARGPVVDTDALTEAVRAGRVRAALDVTDPEPLPADHPLWHLDGVFVTPHVGGSTTAMLPRMARLVRTQVARLAAGEEPLNLVLPRRDVP